MEYEKQYQDKRIYLRDVAKWLNDTETALNIFLGDAGPQYHFLDIFVVEDLLETVTHAIQAADSTISEILIDVPLCNECEEPIEWCIYNNPSCKGNWGR